MRERRANWDILKGLGIFLVVLGHATTGKLSAWIYLFHMPLFFMLSGMLYSQRPSWWDYARRKSRHLLVPYFIYLAAFNAGAIGGFAANVLRGMTAEKAAFYRDHFLSQLSGGTQLSGDLSVFWFITCLFVTQQVYNAISKIPLTLQHTIVVIAYAIALLNQYSISTITLPWALHIVPMALVYFHLGHLFVVRRLDRSVKFFLAACVVSAVVTIVYSLTDASRFHVNMKGSSYGIPVLSVVIASAFTVTSLVVARRLERLPKLGRGLSSLGQSSMTILYLHQFVKHKLFWDQGIHQPMVVTTFTIIVCLGFHWLLTSILASRAFDRQNR